MQDTQYQGLLRQFAVVFLLFVHFLWNRLLHLLQDNSWSLGLGAEGLIERLQLAQ